MAAGEGRAIAARRVSIAMLVKIFTEKGGHQDCLFHFRKDVSYKAGGRRFVTIRPSRENDGVKESGKEGQERS